MGGGSNIMAFIAGVNTTDTAEVNPITLFNYINSWLYMYGLYHFRHVSGIRRSKAVRSIADAWV